jgi:hypothetical protein
MSVDPRVSLFRKQGNNAQFSYQLDLGSQNRSMSLGLGGVPTRTEETYNNSGLGQIPHSTQVQRAIGLGRGVNHHSPSGNQLWETCLTTKPQPPHHHSYGLTYYQQHQSYGSTYYQQQYRPVYQHHQAYRQPDQYQDRNNQYQDRQQQYKQVRQPQQYPDRQYQQYDHQFDDQYRQTQYATNDQMHVMNFNTGFSLSKD